MLTRPKRRSRRDGQEARRPVRTDDQRRRVPRRGVREVTRAGVEHPVEDRRALDVLHLRGEGVQGDVDGGITDGMRRDVPAGTVGVHHPPGQFIEGELEAAGAVVVIAERLGHGGGPADQRAVNENLHGTEPDVAVAEPGRNPEVQAEGNAVRLMGVQRVQGVADGHQLDAGFQKPAASGFGERLA